MDNLKLKALEYFAAKPLDDEKAKKYFVDAYEEIHDVLVNGWAYDSLSSAIEVLEKFISHVADNAIGDLDLCWQRLHEGEELELSDVYFSKYHTKEKIYAKIINLLARLRYLEQERVVPILFRYWEEEESAQKDVEKVFKELAEFNLHAVENMGFSPQLSLLNFILQLSEEDKFKFFPIIMIAFEQFLSTDIEGHSWNYRTLSIRSMAIPESEHILKLRSETVATLVSLYQSTDKIEVKKELLSAMNTACHIWSRAEISDGAKLIVERNTIDVLSFWSSIVSVEPLELIQKIEHDAYWNYYHASSQLVKDAALCVEAEIKNHGEYQVYRDLVGFQGVFGSWEVECNLEVDCDNQQKIREEQVKIHLDNVNKDNLNQWLTRIGLYLETDSRDLATFPELFKFVEVISSCFPEEVLSKLESTDVLDKSAIPIFRGIWSSSAKCEFSEKISQWIDQSRYLWELSVVFVDFDGVDFSLLEKFVNKAVAAGDLLSLSSFLRVLNKRREYLSEDMINKLFENIFIFFNQEKCATWVNHVWFFNKGPSFVEILSKKHIKLLVDNLVYVNNVDYRVERILEHVSQCGVENVFYFFEQRIEYKKRRGKDSEDRYDDIPFNLHSIGGVLAENPKELIALIKNNYEYDYGVFRYGVASLFKECFSPFEPQLVDLILEHLTPSLDGELNLILAIVSSYEGHISILPLVKRLLMEVEYDEDIGRRINSSLISSGVVHGEYGIADAYKRKLEDISPWLKDDHASLVKFAHQYTDLLKRMIEDEIKRVNERVAIEKHKFGLDDND